VLKERSNKNKLVNILGAFSAVSISLGVTYLAFDHPEFDNYLNRANNDQVSSDIILAPLPLSPAPLATPFADRHGFLSGTFEAALTLACDNTITRHKTNCEIAFKANELTGIHPLLMLAKLTLENNGRNTSHVDQDAQGHCQIQSGALITGLYKIGNGMGYFDRLLDNDIRKIAYQKLKSDRSIPDRERADRMMSGSGDNLLSLDEYKALSNLRHDENFCAEFAGLLALDTMPFAHSDYFSTDPDLASVELKEAFAKVYLSWNQGQLAADIINPYIGTDIKIVDLPRSHELNPKYFESNPSIFPEGMDTNLNNFEDALWKQITDRWQHFNHELITAQALSNTHDHMIIENAYRDGGPVETSMRPQQRDAIITALEKSIRPAQRPNIFISGDDIIVVNNGTPKERRNGPG
jgi:hypothetical protein